MTFTKNDLKAIAQALETAINHYKDHRRPNPPKEWEPLLHRTLEAIHPDLPTLRAKRDAALRTLIYDGGHDETELAHAKIQYEDAHSAYTAHMKSQPTQDEDQL